MVCGLLLEREAPRVASLLGPACVVPGAGWGGGWHQQGLSARGEQRVERSEAGAGSFPRSLGPLTLACSCRLPMGPLCVCLCLSFLTKTWSVLGSNPATSFYPLYPFESTVSKQHSRVLRSRV